ncbi:MAG: YitT family protein [Rubrimonas sp.]
MTPAPTPSDRPRHSALDDAQGIVGGVMMAALGLMFLRDAGLVTGQTAGLALIVSYATGVELGLVFLLVNLPFWALAILRVGWRFALKTLAAVALLSAIVAFAPPFVTVGPTHPAAAAAIGGVASGFGLLALFRHGGSLGGVGVLALWLQDSTGFRAGWTQMIVDVCVFSVALLVIDPLSAVWSAFGALLLNLVIALNHRRDRYIAI